MARAEGLPSRCTSRFYLIMMTKKQIEIADFILSQFLEGSPNKDDVHSAIMIRMDMTLSHTMFYNHFKTRDLFMSGEKLIIS